MEIRKKKVKGKFARLIASFSKIFRKNNAEITPNWFDPEEEANLREIIVAYKQGKNIPDLVQLKIINPGKSMIEFVDESGENKKITVKDLMFRGKSKPKNYFDEIENCVQYTPIEYNFAILEEQKVALHFYLQLSGDKIESGDPILQLPAALRPPDSISFVAFLLNNLSRNSYLAKIDSNGKLHIYTSISTENHYFLCVDISYYVSPPTEIYFDVNSSALGNITGDVNDESIYRILSYAGRCLAKKTDNGQITICKLDANDSTKYYDGTDVGLTDEELGNKEVDVMVYLPEFWYKSERKDAILTLSFIEKEEEENETEDYIYVPASLIGAYKAYQKDSKLYSRSGVTPTNNVSQASFISYAQARGTGYNIIDYYQHCQIALLFYAKYGNRSSQAILGTGNASTATQTGGTNNLGNRDTKNTTSGWVNFIGIEGVHGGCNECVSGVTIQNHEWTIPDIDPEKSAHTIIAGSTEGYITHIAAEAGGYFDMIPTDVNDSADTYYADYYYPDTGNSNILVRSSTSDGKKGGVAYIKALSNSETYKDVGSRLSFRGEIKEAVSAEDFRDLLKE